MDSLDACFAGGHGVLAVDAPPEEQARRAARDFIAAIESEPEWERLFFEFSAYAARNEDFRAELVTRYRELRARIAAIVAQSGRTSTMLSKAKKAARKTASAAKKDDKRAGKEAVGKKIVAEVTGPASDEVVSDTDDIVERKGARLSRGSRGGWPKSTAPEPSFHGSPRTGS